MSIADVANLSQVVIAVLTLIGILVTVHLAVRTARELDRDRKLRYAPYLAFEPGGTGVPIRFVKAGRSIPGIDPDYVAKVFSTLPLDAQSVRIDFDKQSRYGTLRNYGVGPALEIHIVWVAESITIGNERFSIDSKKREEPVYSTEMNQMPSVPGHILPGQTGELSRLPTFIDKDVDRKILEVHGELLITCLDVFRQSHGFRQQFFVFTEYSQSEPRVGVTFGDLIISSADSIQNTGLLDQFIRIGGDIVVKTAANFLR